MSLTTQQEELLVSLYARQAVSLDRLPYTSEFESLCREFNARHGAGHPMHFIWSSLITLRKSGKLPARRRRLSDDGVMRE